MSIQKITFKRIEVIAGEDGYFNYPSGICFNPDNDEFYITDLHNSRICSFNRKTHEKRTLTTRIMMNSGIQHLKRPLGISYNPLVGLAVTDVEYNMIFVLDKDNDIWIPIIEDYMVNNDRKKNLNLPSGVAVDDDGNFYTNDFLNNRICRIAPDGRIDVLIDSSIGNEDADTNEIIKIDKPYGIYLSNNRLYFTDTGNHMIRYVQLNDNTLHSIRIDKDILELNSPIAVTLDNKGYIYVCEQRRIYCVDPNTNSCVFLINKDNWRNYMQCFHLKERLCYAGAIFVRNNREVYWLDTIKNLIYRITM